MASGISGASRQCIDNGRGRGPRGILLLGGALVLPLDESDEPVA